MSKSKTNKASGARKSKRTKVDNAASSSPDIERTTDGIANKAARRISDESIQQQEDKEEAQWWKIHLDKASTLINKCMKAYNWDKDTAKRVFASYRQFLVVKKEEEDWSVEPKLKPCWSVDRMWEEHTDMEDYSFDMETLCGHVVHRPNSSWEGGDEDLTRDTIRQRFDKDFDRELWTNVKLLFRGQLYDTKLVEVNVFEPISCQYYKYLTSKPVTLYGDDEDDLDIEDDYRFVYEERDIQEGDTPISLGMMTGSGREIVVSAIHKNKVKLTICHPNDNDMLGCLTFKDDPLLYPFEQFAKTYEDVSLKELVFTVKGRRLYTFDSPAVLKLSDGDMIRATPVNEYHTEGCICCQKKQNPLEFATDS